MKILQRKKVRKNKEYRREYGLLKRLVLLPSFYNHFHNHLKPQPHMRELIASARPGNTIVRVNSKTLTKQDFRKVYPEEVFPRLYRKRRRGDGTSFLVLNRVRRKEQPILYQARKFLSFRYKETLQHNKDKIDKFLADFYLIIPKYEDRYVTDLTIRITQLKDCTPDEVVAVMKAEFGIQKD